MRFLIALACALIAVPASSPVDAQTRSPPLVVQAVPGGDTIVVATVGRVRLLGVRLPGGRARPDGSSLARAARERLAALVLRRWVRLEEDQAVAGRESRTAAYVFREDGVFVNAELLRDGLARLHAPGLLSRLEELQRAEADAHAYGRGLWAVPDATEWRTDTASARRAGAPSPPAPRCAGTTRRGTPCQRRARTGSRFCAQHAGG